jgi:hypothetical protein
MCRHVAAVVGLCLVFSGGVEAWRMARPAPARRMTAVLVQGDPNDPRGREVDDLRNRRDRFELALQRVTDELGQRRTNLAEATDYLFFFCVQSYPEYLDHLWIMTPGASTRLKLAHNLIACFRADLEISSAAERAQLLRLIGELEQQLDRLANASESGDTDRVTVTGLR